MIAVRLRVVVLPQTPVWSPPSSTMIATSNFAHIIAPVPVSVNIVALLLVIWTTMTAAVPLTAALVTAFVATKLPMTVVDVRCCTLFLHILVVLPIILVVIHPMHRMPIILIMHDPPCIVGTLRQPSRDVVDGAFALPLNAEDRLPDQVVGLLIASLAVLRETEQRLLGGNVDAPVRNDLQPALEESVLRESPSISRPRPCIDDRTAA